MLISHRVEGIIFASTNISKDYLKKQLDTFRIPIVIFDNQINGLKLNAVFHDNIKGTELLIEHLIQIHGKRKIAFIGGPIKETSCEQRLQGYKNSLLKNDIMINDNYIKTGEWNPQSGYDLTREIFVKEEIPESIFIASTNMALGTLSYLNKKGFNVPDDISIVSFDDLDYASIIYPPLTTLNKVEERIGHEAAKILLDRINSKNLDKVEEIVIPMKIVVRQSCGCKISD